MALPPTNFIHILDRRNIHRPKLDLGKKYQVAQMGLIYSKADVVIAWLGMDEAISRALVFCNELESLAGQAWLEKRKELWRPPVTEDSRKLRKSFEALSESPYWNRAWITQELLLACKVTLLADEQECGPRAILELYNLGYPWFESWAPEPVERLFMADTKAICGKRLVRGSPLVTLLYELPGKECMIPRDQIYSLISVASNARTMPIDYGGTPDRFLDQFLRTVEHSLCLCSWDCIRKTLRLRGHNYGYIYTEPIFRVQMKLSTSRSRDLRCQTCEAKYWGTDEIAKDSPTCIMATCGAFRSHFVLRKHEIDTNIKFALQCGSDDLQEIQLAYAELESTIYSRSDLLPHEPTINVYIKATAVEAMLDHIPPVEGSVCSATQNQEGCMAVYHGIPLGSRPPQFEDLNGCSFVQDNTGAFVLQIDTKR
jgi:hypothetical protein